MLGWLVVVEGVDAEAAVDAVDAVEAVRWRAGCRVSAIERLEKDGVVEALGTRVDVDVDVDV